MTPDEWLNANDKKPYRPEGHGYNSTFWGTLADVDEPDPDPSELDFLLPDNLFLRLEGKLTYPNVRRYNSPEDALEDFRQAFYQTTTEGWMP